MGPPRGPKGPLVPKGPQGPLVPRGPKGPLGPGGGWGVGLVICTWPDGMSPQKRGEAKRG